MLPDYTIDSRTAIELLIVGNLLAAGLFLVHRQVQRFPYLYVAGRLAQAMGFLLFLHKSTLPMPLWYVLGNALIQLGWISEVLAISTVQAPSPRLQRLFLAIAVVAIGHLLLNWALSASVGTINFSISLVLIAIFLVPALRLLGRPDGSPLRRTVGLFYLLFCLINLLRAWYAWRSGDVSLMTANLMHSLWFVGLFALLVVGTIGYMLLLKEDADRQLLQAATTDPLTGVFNRRAFFAEAGRLREAAVREHATLSVLMCDLDHFKRVNDGHGHAIGDQVLQAFAGCARSQLRPGDVFGRLGGEEFCAVLRADADVAAAVAQRIRVATSQLRFESPAPLRLSVSIGLASAAGATLEDLLQRADACLYQAKQAGRDRVVGEG